MPLLNHFNPPLSRTHPWRSFHGAWAAAIARLLNQGILPTGFYAVPLVDRAGPVDTLENLPATWEAPQPGRAVAVEWTTDDSVEVQVYADDGDPRLAAAIELVSPRNKDRAQARQAFAVKCVSYLQQRCSLVTIDTVITRRADLNAEILTLLGIEPTNASSSLEATAYRIVGWEQESPQLQLWSNPLALGDALPTLPLWIAAELAVPLDLDASYRATCADLRIRPAG